MDEWELRHIFFSWMNKFCCETRFTWIVACRVGRAVLHVNRTWLREENVYNSKINCEKFVSEPKIEEIKIVYTHWRGSDRRHRDPARKSQPSRRHRHRRLHREAEQELQLKLIFLDFRHVVRDAIIEGEQEEIRRRCTAANKLLQIQWRN